MRGPLRFLSLTSLTVGGLVVGLFLLNGPAAVQTLTIDPTYTLVRTDQITRTQFDFT